ncbi:MAG: hypothetical protein LBD32_00960 [Cytophagales bacterium]|nr:hypothetical protein [Cytophagales bacterium]
MCVAAGVIFQNNFDTKALSQLVTDTQKFFTNRKHNQERWEISPLDWMKKSPEQYLTYIKNLEFFIDDMLINCKSYGAACVLGTDNSKMQYRMQYLEKLVESGINLDKIFFVKWC